MESVQEKKTKEKESRVRQRPLRHLISSLGPSVMLLKDTNAYQNSWTTCTFAEDASEDILSESEVVGMPGCIWVPGRASSVDHLFQVP